VTSEVDITTALDMGADKFGQQVNVAVSCAGIGIATKVQLQPLATARPHSAGTLNHPFRPLVPTLVAPSPPPAFTTRSVVATRWTAAVHAG
jgi:hypothetical protein